MLMFYLVGLVVTAVTTIGELIDDETSITFVHVVLVLAWPIVLTAAALAWSIVLTAAVLDAARGERP
ncbi:MULTISPECIES: hypothetical protein [unclassified Sphingomonas]|uniref:hypothetical protein n=1 Tax=unclassified Sphingomonas TaxID=196159 RepID=UPI0008313F7A|nr:MULTISPECIES: hypothetical protein [unclassified Sphingomonas]